MFSRIIVKHWEGVFWRRITTNLLWIIKRLLAAAGGRHAVCLHADPKGCECHNGLESQPTGVPKIVDY